MSAWEGGWILSFPDLISYLENYAGLCAEIQIYSLSVSPSYELCLYQVPSQDTGKPGCTSDCAANVQLGFGHSTGLCFFPPSSDSSENTRGHRWSSPVSRDWHNVQWTRALKLYYTPHMLLYYLLPGFGWEVMGFLIKACIWHVFPIPLRIERISWAHPCKSICRR